MGTSGEIRFDGKGGNLGRKGVCINTGSGYNDGECQRRGDLLLEAQGYYTAMYRFRERRDRNRRYAYGDQWEDEICVDGCWMTEREYLAKQGCVAMKNNLIQRMVRNVIGVYRQQATEPTCIARDREEQSYGETMSTVLQCNMQMNHMGELYARSLEEFLLSGFVVHKKTFGVRDGKCDCWTDTVRPSNFFIDNKMRDHRGWDCTFLGELHDVRFGDVIREFANGREDVERLRRIYGSMRGDSGLIQSWQDFGFSGDPDRSFLIPEDVGMCRVIEIWRKENKPRYRCHDTAHGELFKIDESDYEVLVSAENARRRENGEGLIEVEWMIDTVWCYYYLTPYGDVLRCGETPYAHGGHPYVFKCYPFIDGELRSFVGDVIDQQRYVNRLITLYDMIMRSSAKGVLLVPEDALGNMSREEFAQAWSKPNGMVVYKPSRSGERPQQITANSVNIGIEQLLQLQLKMFEDVSGVNGSLQGKAGFSGMSASLYNQQTQNATTSLLDVLDTFGDFVRDAAYKDVRNIQQFYTSARMVKIAGRGAYVLYDPVLMGDVEFDLSIVPSTSTPVYRALNNELLLQMWKAQAISLEQMLKVGNFPFADELLQQLEAQKEEMAAAQAMQGDSPVQ